MSKRNKRVYIAGPMRGHPEENHEAFDHAEKLWESKGYEVASPARLVRALGLGKQDPNNRDENPREFLEEVFTHDCMIICRCDALVVLPGWERSKGATMEVALAQAIGIPIYWSTGGNVGIPDCPWYYIERERENFEAEMRQDSNPVNPG